MPSTILHGLPLRMLSVKNVYFVNGWSVLFVSVKSSHLNCHPTILFPC
jgi:hypothetical protein